MDLILASVGENIGSELASTQLHNAGVLPQITMNDLQYDIYNTVLDMMFNGKDKIGAGSHTTALLNDASHLLVIKKRI